MKKIKYWSVFLFLSSFLIISCAPAIETTSAAQPTTAPAETAQSPACPDLSSIWLGQVTDTIEGEEFESPWALLFEQSGCEVKGKLAANPDGPALDCAIEGGRLVCQFSAGENCANTLDLEIEDDKLTGTLLSCFGTNSSVALKRSSARELEEFLGGEAGASAFPANPHPVGCYLQTFYKEGFNTIFCERFDDNSNGWPIGSGSVSLGLTGASIESGRMVLDVSGMTDAGEEAAVLHGLPPVAYADDFLFQAVGRILSESSQAAWGLAFEGEFRGGAQSRYLFLISNGGQYTLQYFDGARLSPLVPPVDSSLIYRDRENILAIFNDGRQYDLYINGTVVESLELSPLADTGMALSVSVPGGVDAQFILDEILVRSRPQ